MPVKVKNLKLCYPLFKNLYKKMYDFRRHKIFFNLAYQRVYNERAKNSSDKIKKYCLYTHRYRSVHSSYRMSRHKLKEFLDNSTFFNIYVK